MSATAASTCCPAATSGACSAARDAERSCACPEDVEQRAKPVVLPMRRGDVLAFSNLTCHASTLNTTDEMRWSVDLRYVVPEAAAARSDDARDGYATIYDHYRMRPMPWPAATRTRWRPGSRSAT